MLTVTMQQKFGTGRVCLFHSSHPAEQRFCCFCKLTRMMTDNWNIFLVCSVVYYPPTPRPIHTDTHVHTHARKHGLTHARTPEIKDRTLGEVTCSCFCDVFCRNKTKEAISGFMLLRRFLTFM